MDAFIYWPLHVFAIAQSGTTIVSWELQMFSEIALGIGHNLTLRHRISWAVRMDYILWFCRLTFGKCVLWSLLETSRVKYQELQAFLSRPVTPSIQPPTNRAVVWRVWVFHALTRFQTQFDFQPSIRLDKTSIVTLDFAMPISPFMEHPYAYKLVYEQSYMLLLCSRKIKGLCAVLSSRASYFYPFFAVTT